MPRRVVFGVANSLDNFIARPDGGVDWLRWSDDAQKIMQEFWPRFDTVIMGRKTYEVALKMGGEGTGLYPGMKTYVFSRTIKPRNVNGAEIVRGDAAKFVRRLKSEPGKDICCMGGGELAKSLFDAGLIDEIGVNVHPVLLGSGVPLFLKMNHQIDLELIESRPIQYGCVYMLYRVSEPRSVKSSTARKKSAKAVRARKKPARKAARAKEKGRTLSKRRG